MESDVLIVRAFVMKDGEQWNLHLYDNYGEICEFKNVDQAAIKRIMIQEHFCNWKKYLLDIGQNPPAQERNLFS